MNTSNMFNNPLWSDIDLVLAVENTSESKTYHTHKAVLAAASPFLYDLLSSCQEDKKLVLNCVSLEEVQIVEDCLLILYNQGTKLNPCFKNEHLIFAIKYRLNSVLYFILSTCADRAVYSKISFKLIDEACYCVFDTGLCSSLSYFDIRRKYVEHIQNSLVQYIKPEDLDNFGHVLDKSHGWLKSLILGQLLSNQYQFHDALLLNILRLCQKGYLTQHKETLIELFSLKDITNAAAKCLINHPFVQNSHNLCKKFLNESINVLPFKTDNDITVKQVVKLSKMKVQEILDGDDDVCDCNFSSKMPCGWLGNTLVNYSRQKVVVRFNYDSVHSVVANTTPQLDSKFSQKFSANMRITYGEDHDFVEEECTHFMKVTPGQFLEIDVLTYGALQNHIEDDEDEDEEDGEEALNEHDEFYTFTLTLTFHL